MSGYGYPLFLRVLEMGALLAALVFTVMIWRTTRIGGFGVLAALKGYFLLQMLLLPAFVGLTGGSNLGWLQFTSLAAGVIMALAMWNILGHVRRIWAPAEVASPPPPPPPSG